MVHSRQSTRSRVIASHTPHPPTTFAPTADAAPPPHATADRRQLGSRGHRHPRSIDAHDTASRRHRARLDARTRWIKIIPIHPSTARVFTPLAFDDHAERSSPSSSRSKPRPSRLARTHLHDGELPRSTPAASFVPFACDDAAAALNMSTLARPSRTTDRRRPTPTTTTDDRRRRRADGCDRVESINRRTVRAPDSTRRLCRRARAPRLGLDRTQTDARSSLASHPSLAHSLSPRSLARSRGRRRVRAFAHDRAPRRAPHCRRRRRASRGKGSARGTPRAVGTGGRGRRRHKS